MAAFLQLFARQKCFLHFLCSLVTLHVLLVPDSTASWSSVHLGIHVDAIRRLYCFCVYVSLLLLRRPRKCPRFNRWLEIKVKSIHALSSTVPPFTVLWTRTNVCQLSLSSIWPQKVCLAFFLSLYLKIAQQSWRFKQPLSCCRRAVFFVFTVGGPNRNWNESVMTRRAASEWILTNMAVLESGQQGGSAGRHGEGKGRQTDTDRASDRQMDKHGKVIDSRSDGESSRGVCSVCWMAFKTYTLYRRYSSIYPLTPSVCSPFCLFFFFSPNAVSSHTHQRSPETNSHLAAGCRQVGP